MGKNKVDLHEFKNSIIKGDLSRWICEVPGCRQTIIWWDLRHDYQMTADGRRVDLGDDWGLVYSTCDNCGLRLCPHPNTKPSPNKIQGLPSMFYVPPKSKLWTPGRNDNFDIKRNTGLKSSLPEEYHNSLHCMQEAIWIDQMGKARTIVSCRNKKCMESFKDDGTQKRRKKNLLGG